MFIAKRGAGSRTAIAWLLGSPGLGVQVLTDGTWCWEVLGDAPSAHIRDSAQPTVLLWPEIARSPGNFMYDMVGVRQSVGVASCSRSGFSGGKKNPGTLSMKMLLRTSMVSWIL